MNWHPIGNESDIPSGEMKCVSIDNVDIDVFHLEDGWYATSDVCTHQDCSLAEGEIEGGEIICWCHGGAFNIRTGVATRMPCTIPVEIFAVRIRDGKIEIEFD